MAPLRLLPGRLEHATARREGSWKERGSLTRKKVKRRSLSAELVTRPPYYEGQAVKVLVGWTGLTKSEMGGQVTSALSDRVSVWVGGKSITFVIGKKGVVMV